MVVVMATAVVKVAVLIRSAVFEYTLGVVVWSQVDQCVQIRQWKCLL